MKDFNWLVTFEQVKRILAFIVLIILTSCSRKNYHEGNNFFLLESDLEKIEGKFFTSSGDTKIKGSKDVSTDFSRSGRSSIKLNADSQFGLDFDFNNVKKGDVIKASVWRKSNDIKKGVLGISGINSEEEQLELSSDLLWSVDDWDFIQCYFVAQKDFETVKVYAYSSADEPTYFDDIKIEGYFKNKKPDSSFSALNISISDSNFTKLKSLRKTALKNEVISKDEKEYFSANIVVDGVEVPASLRFKGDWTDHLETNKWSFRIKLKGDNRFMGLKTFSIQNPTTRSFMKEWFAHKLFEKEDILTTKYTFIPVIINGEKMGVYAIEEHFDKQLLESQNRREAPIVKFDESGMWEQLLNASKGGKHATIPELESSTILPFKKNRTYKSPVLFNLFKLAQAQMEKYRNFNPHIDSYFDINIIAKYLALCDIHNGKHGLAWHNQRFYINPITAKLEPIGFDCFGEHSEILGGILGLEKDERSKLWQSCLQNEELSILYKEWLKKYSNEDYLQGVFDSLEEDILKLETLFRFEDPSFQFDRSYFIRINNQIKAELHDYDGKRKGMKKNFPHKVKHSKLDFGMIYNGASLKAYRDSKDSVSTSVILRNFHLENIEVVGYSVKQGIDSVIPVSSFIIERFKETYIQKKIILAGNAKRIFFKAANCGDSIFSEPISKWGLAENVAIIKRQLPFFIKQHEVENKFIINSGTYTVKNDIVIPKGCELIIQPGVKMNFINSAAFISYSPVQLLGDSLSPIVISSSDKTANGFTVIAQSTSSQIRHTKFNGFKSLNKNCRSLTGAVTFYESDVKIDYCSFSNNHSEDALNLIRCSFEMKNSVVENTFSDGFDADFCTGNLQRCSFKNMGNDGVDFSGSNISIEYCKIENARDKAISGGEKSKLRVINCKINHSSIAIASKDLTGFIVDGITISNCNIAFAAYRKKPEYGPAKINVLSAELNSFNKLHLLEEGSKLFFLKKEYMGNQAFNIDSMYSQFK